MKRLSFLACGLLPVLAGCGSTGPAHQDPPSVLVSTVAPHQGSLPEVVTAYGVAAPSTTGVETISSAQAGQVAQLLVTPNVAVRAGQALAIFEVAPTARSLYHQAVNALTAARRQRARLAQLLSQQLATADQLTQADKAVADALASKTALETEGAGQARRTLSAPFDGVITAIAVSQGDRTQPGASIMTVARTGAMVVSVGVDPARRPALSIGQPATLRRLAGGGTMRGQVIRVDSALNARTRLVDVDVSFPGGSLLPGEGMEVGIETRPVSGWLVPHASVVTSSGEPRLFQIVNGRAKAVPIRILLSSDTEDVVDGPLAQSRAVVVAGAYQINDGDQVRTRP